MVLRGLNMAESLSTRSSGTSTTAVWTSNRPAEALVGVLPRVTALKMVVLPDWGKPMIPNFILTLTQGMCILGALIKPEWRNWHTRTTQTRVGLAHEGSIPSFGIIFRDYPRANNAL